METMTEVLMLAARVGLCPDCGEERILLPVDPDDAAGDGPAYCCTTCDAAVVVLDELSAASRRTRPLVHRLAG